MMAIKILSATHNGIEGIIIKVEVDISKGLPMFNIVGLPSATVKEAKDRVRAAILNSGFDFPLGRITINLAPADIKKIGSFLDLPIAIGILMESKQIELINPEEYLLFGELSLSGELKGIKGTLPIILEGMKEKINKFIFPYDNLEESYYLDDGEYYPFKTLKEVVSFITYKDVLPNKHNKITDVEDNYFEDYDYGKIIGQNSSKRAMEIAAAGKHNIIMYGEPGCGKTMLANAIRTILPPLSREELMEIAKIYSIFGLLKKKQIIRRPFRAPHHTTTNIALVGGGKEIRPGEITLAHNGVLFLDEILEFKKEVLEALREPLEEKYMNVSRLNANYKMPCNFLLIGAFNPTERKDERITTDGMYYISKNTKRYYNKFSDALMDRIDIINYVPRLNYNEICEKQDEYNSAIMRERVLNARRLQEERLKNTCYAYNSEIKGKDIFDLCKLNSKCREIMEYYYNNSNLSMRGYTKIIKLARTIADIDNKTDIDEGSILEAFSYRKDINGELI